MQVGDIYKGYIPGQYEQHGAEAAPLAVLQVGDVVLEVELDLLAVPLDARRVPRTAAAGSWWPWTQYGYRQLHAEVLVRKIINQKNRQW